VPVIHIRHRGASGGVFAHDARRGAICDSVAPLAGEVVIDKPRPDSFSGTDLEEVFRATGRKGLIMAGFMTHMCVSSTARTALNLGIPITLVTAATATRDLPDGAGGVIPAADLQRAELAALADRFVVLVPRAADLSN
jgi:nicotinamidase-related amidase